MTLIYTCPNAKCGEPNPIYVTHCTACGKGLLPADAPRMRRRRCVYCGRQTHGNTCPAHRSLVAVDPEYAEARL